MAYVRKEPNRPQGFVDPTSSYTAEQLKEFSERYAKGDPTLDEPLDLHFQRSSEVTVLEILQDEKYSKVRYRLQQPVVSCNLTSFSNYLINFQNWFNPGRLAWWILAVLSELDRKPFRENHLSTIPTELDRAYMKFKAMVKDAEDNDDEGILLIRDDLVPSLETYRDFLNDITSGRVVNLISRRSSWIVANIPKVEYTIRLALSNILNEVVIAYKYNIKDDLGEELYKEFKEDCGDLLTVYDLSNPDYLVPDVFCEI